jgi:site-specific DNA recombinase
LNDIAPRIKELRNRQDELKKTRVQVEVDMVVPSVSYVDMAVVKAYAQDLKALLEGADYVERKAFLRSFVKRIEVIKDQVTIRYKLPTPQSGKNKDVRVLPIDTPGGAGGVRTPYLLRAKQAFSQLNYGPALYQKL